MIGVRRLLSDLQDVQEIASGSSVRERRVLISLYGKGRWRKMKGTARVETDQGDIVLAEIHWYEAHGIGRRKMKVKRKLE